MIEKQISRHELNHHSSQYDNMLLSESVTGVKLAGILVIQL